MVRPLPRSDELLARCTFPAAGTVVELGVSGGPDSTALLILAVAAGCSVTAVHVDHGLRDGSAEEADVVAEAARRFGATFRSVRVEVAPGSNLEARARAARYVALGPHALVGHTADDRAETVLMHLLRGAGADGIGALCPPDPRRPMLRLRRCETVALCDELDVTTVADPSNDDRRFVRNRVRHELLPLMADIVGRDVVPTLVRTSDLLAGDEVTLSGLAVEVDPTDARAVAALDEPVANRVLRRWLSTAHGGYCPDAAEVHRVLDVARGTSRATDLVGGWRVARRDQQLRLEAPGEPS